MNIDLGAELSQQYNQFIENYNKNASCGTECQQANEASQLKQNYLNAVNNLNTAPEQVQSTYKSYLTYTQGNGAYQQYEQNNYQQSADNIANTYQANFNESMNEAQILLNTYSTLYANFKNVFDLNKIYKKENIELKKNVSNNDEDIITNDRKTYYENQATDSLKIYYWIFIIIYTLIVLYYAISILIKKSTYSLKVRVIILILLIIYPFISLWISLKMIKLYHIIVGVLPKNQYKTL